MTPARPVAIVGIGASELGRDLAASAGTLAVEACRAALADAGIDAAAVDGVATFLGAYEGAAIDALVPALGVPEDRLRYAHDGMSLAPAAPSAVIEAAAAIGRGDAEVVLAFKANKWTRGRPPGATIERSRVGGPQQFEVPYGQTMVAQALALWASRHFHEHGTGEEHLGAIVLANRRHAARNPAATLRTPLSLDDYLASPWISTPLRKLDCDYPIDGAGAVVLAAADRARDARRAPVWVLGGTSREAAWEEWLHWPDLTTSAAKAVTDRLWAETGARPQDVDVAGLYDGFSILELLWLEDAGFCAKGDGGPFAASGALDLGGRLPTNTHGGNLSEGRTHGIGQVLEIVAQLRRDAGERQVAGAEIGFVGAGGGPLAGALLLSTAR